MGRLFGTDGVRGLANSDLTPELALSLAAAAAGELAATTEGHRPVAVVGRDPRASGHMLEAAVIAGLTSAGTDVLRVGVLPTPAIAYLTAATGADLGVMLSASHNAMPDNGIKFFARGGVKLPDSVEDAIEARMSSGDADRPTGANVGRVRDHDTGADEYVRHLLSSVDADLHGLRVVVDCAHGAASLVAPEMLRRAGAEVIAIGCDPDGDNINEQVGSTHLDHVRDVVLREGADVGIAHDGDADRCLAVDAKGDTVDGDQILAILALAMKDAGTLRGNTLVATVMSNLGLRRAMDAAGIAFVETPVGDRYVLEAMQAGGYSLGGEQSGHVILLDHSPTGDGLLTALHLLARVASSGEPLTDLAAVMTRYPQVLINVSGVDRSSLDDCLAVSQAVETARAELGNEGRVLLRPSGTEPLIRVMVEAGDDEQAHAVAGRLADVVRESLPL